MLTAAQHLQGREDSAAGTVAMIRDAGGEAVVFHADVSNRDQMERMFAHCTATLGGVDICVPNAYYSHRAPFLELDFEGVQKTVEVTMFGTFHACQLAARPLATSLTPSLTPAR